MEVEAREEILQEILGHLIEVSGDVWKSHDIVDKLRRSIIEKDLL